MKNDDRNWTVLFVGGASGIGKSSIAYEIGRHYGVNVMEVDDVHLSVKTVTTRDHFPAIHYFDSGSDWKDLGVNGNVNWLIDVSKEMVPVLKEIAKRHIEDNVPIIIEGDFISPELAASFDRAEVKSIFIQESDKNQIVQNYLAREGGELQEFRAEISTSYNNWIAETCKSNGMKLIESRPWNTVLNRTIYALR
ncbi:hypothetical protein [Paenibacillus xanthanilyticus]|uniref:UDP-N-acetylglucosamine kinase n=1 Tax=Paenibacillus xanthanilyticus TaxID=1783531 RepID=A0ABV8K9A3_9BACL